MTKKTVYLLSRGEYQDYRWVGVYTTEKKAQKVLKNIAKFEVSRIEKIKLNTEY